VPPPLKPTSTTFGLRLRELRLRAGLSQEKLGVAAGMDESVATVRIGRYETGVHAPDSNTVDDLSKALGVPPPYFHCEDDDLAEVIFMWNKLTKSDQLRIKAFVEGLST